VYDRLSKDGYHVSVVQEPLTSLADDVAAARRVSDLPDGPTISVAHSYGGPVISEAGTEPNNASQRGLLHRNVERCNKRLTLPVYKKMTRVLALKKYRRTTVSHTLFHQGITFHFAFNQTLKKLTLFF